MSARIITIVALVALVAAQVDSYACATKGGLNHYSQGSFKGQPAAQWQQSSQQVNTPRFEAPVTSFAPAKGSYQQTHEVPAVSSMRGSSSYQQEQRLESGSSAQLELPAQTVQQPELAPAETTLVPQQEQHLETSQSVLAAPTQVEAQSEMPMSSVPEPRMESGPMLGSAKGFHGQSYSSGQSAAVQRPELMPQKATNTHTQVEKASAMPLAYTLKA